MNKVLMMVLVGVFMAGSANVVFAEYDDKGSMHGDMKGSTTDHKSDANKGKIQVIMKDYIAEKSTGPGGTLELKDPKSGEARNLIFVELHDKVGMKNDMHYSCADFTDADTKDLVDVDLYIDVSEGEIKVSEALIHKVNGEYVDGSKAMDKGSTKGSQKGSGY